jgi:hypothetical protein
MRMLCTFLFLLLTSPPDLHTLTLLPLCRKQKGKDWAQHLKDKKHGGDKHDEAEKGAPAVEAGQPESTTAPAAK